MEDEEMSLRRALWLAIPVALVIGCKDESAPAPAPTATATAEAVKTPAATAAPTAAPSASADHGKHAGKGRRHPGIAGALFHAAHELDLKDAQKATLEKLTTELHAGGGQMQEMKDYHAALTAQVKAGKIETAKLDPLQAAAEKAQKARRDKDAEALNGLYALLEPAQRKALVAAVRAKQAAHKAPDPAKAEAHAKQRLEHLTKTLDLDAAQQKKVEPLLAKDTPPTAMADEMKKHSDAVLTAFEADGFDAKKLEPAGAPPGKGMMASHVQFLTALLPLLKPEQREKLAASYEKPHAMHGEHGASGAPGGEEPAEEAPAEE
jgi:Spy/CpxP family protein refolding chaperone